MWFLLGILWPYLARSLSQRFLERTLPDSSVPPDPTVMQLVRFHCDSIVETLSLSASATGEIRTPKIQAKLVGLRDEQDTDRLTQCHSYYTMFCTVQRISPLAPISSPHIDYPSLDKVHSLSHHRDSHGTTYRSYTELRCSQLMRDFLLYSIKTQQLDINIDRKFSGLIGRPELSPMHHSLLHPELLLFATLPHVAAFACGPIV